MLLRYSNIQMNQEAPIKRINCVEKAHNLTEYHYNVDAAHVVCFLSHRWQHEVLKHHTNKRTQVTMACGIPKMSPDIPMRKKKDELRLYNKDLLLSTS